MIELGEKGPFVFPVLENVPVGETVSVPGVAAKVVNVESLEVPKLLLVSFDLTR